MVCTKCNKELIFQDIYDISYVYPCDGNGIISTYQCNNCDTYIEVLEYFTEED